MSELSKVEILEAERRQRALTYEDKVNEMYAILTNGLVDKVHSTQVLLRWVITLLGLFLVSQVGIILKTFL